MPERTLMDLGETAREVALSLLRSGEIDARQELQAVELVDELDCRMGHQALMSLKAIYYAEQITALRQQ